MKNKLSICNLISQYGYVACIILVSILFFIRNLILPQNLSDTLLYHFYYPSTPVEDVPHGVVKDHPIQSISDVIQSQQHHYYNMNGRAIVHTLIQIYCGLLDNNWYSVLAMIMFGLFIWITGTYCFNNISNQNKWIYFLPIGLLYGLIIQPNCICGIVGGFNYLYSSLICVLFWYILTEKNTPNNWRMIPLALFSFIVGWSFEGIVLPLGIAVSVYVLFNFKQIPLSKIIMIAFFVLGACFLVFAPSNFKRASDGLGWTYHSLTSYLIELRCFYVFLVVLFFGIIKRKKDIIPLLHRNKCLLLAVIGSFFAFSLIKNAPPRVGYGVELWSVILTCRLLSDLIDQNVYPIIGKITALIISTILITAIVYQTKSNQQIKELTTQLQNSNDSVCTVCISSNQIPKHIRRYVTQIMDGEKPSFWLTEVWKWYYEKSQINVLFKDDIPNINTIISGNGNIFRNGNWFYSTSEITNELRIAYHINYKYNIKYRLLGIYHRTRHHKIDMKVKISHPITIPINVNGITYYGFYVWDEISPTWIIDSIDLIEVETCQTHTAA